MKKRIILLIITIYTLTIYSWGQEGNGKFLFLEAGIDGIGCAAPKKDYIRAINTQNPDFYADRIKSLMSIEYIGIKFEKRLMDDLFGLSAGLRYSRMNNSIGRDSYMSSGVDYFYLNYSQSYLNTEYAKVCEIIQKTDYVGIPLEVRLYPKKENKSIFKLYYKAGVSFNIKVNSRSDISFFNESMLPYQAEVLKVIEKPSPNFTSFHIGLGLKIGKSNRPGISIETYTPIGVRFPEGTYLVEPLAGSGIQFLVCLPLNTKEQ
jgi:hypothetical protein